MGGEDWWVCLRVGRIGGCVCGWGGLVGMSEGGEDWWVCLRVGRIGGCV